MKTSVSIEGRATRDAEVRFTPGGQTVASFGVAVNTRKKLMDGTWSDGDPEFYDVSAWGKLAEGCGVSVTKGELLVITGKLNYRTWETNEGDKRNKIEITADAVGRSLLWDGEDSSRGQQAAPVDQSEEPF